MKNCFLILCILIASHVNVYAQIASEIDSKTIEKADEYIENDRFAEALPLYLKVIKKDSLNPELNFLIGVCYIHSNNQKFRAIRYSLFHAL